MEGGAGYDISASTSAASAARQTVANRNDFSFGNLSFGTKQDNTMMYILGGAVVLFVLLKFTGKSK